MKQSLSILEAYWVMTRFIENYHYQSGETVDIAGWLGAMKLSSIPNPARFTIESQGFEPLDRGIWAKWLRAVSSVVGDQKEEMPRMLSALEAYTAVYRLVNAWYEEGGKSEEPFKILLHNMTLQRNGELLAVNEWLPDGGEPLDPRMWGEWLNAINAVENEGRANKE